MSEEVKVVVTLNKAQYENLQSIPYGSIGAKLIYDKIKKCKPLSKNKGEWIDNGNGSYTCSDCKTEWTTSQIEKMRFCPTCGNPKLRGDKAE